MSITKISLRQPVLSACNQPGNIAHNDRSTGYDVRCSVLRTAVRITDRTTVVGTLWVQRWQRAPSSRGSHGALRARCPLTQLQIRQLFVARLFIFAEIASVEGDR